MEILQDKTQTLLSKSDHNLSRQNSFQAIGMTNIDDRHDSMNEKAEYAKKKLRKGILNKHIIHTHTIFEYFDFGI